MVEAPAQAPPKITVDDFEFYKTVGEGSFGQVFLALHKEKNVFVAIKQLNKQDLIKKDKTQAVMREKELLKLLVNKPFIIRLEMTFMDREHLYFVFEHCKYGTLSQLISLSGRLEPNVAVFYSASILLALQQCFDLKVMHRDVKPENILIDEQRHVKLVRSLICFYNLINLLPFIVQIDFGDAKQYEDSVFDFSWEYGDSASTAT